MKNKNEFLLSEVLNMFLEEHHRTNDYWAHKIDKIWREVMGNPIAQYTQKTILKNNTLIVYISNPIIKQELLICKSSAITLINNHLKNNIVKTLDIR